LRTYETLYIVRPDLSDEDVQAIADDITAQVSAAGGEVIKAETWGKRRLAYEVQKCSEGYYVLVRFTATPEFVAKLENHFRLTDTIIRFLIVHFDERALRLEASQKKRKEAELRNAANAPRREDDDEEEDEPVHARSRRYADDDDDDQDDMED